MALVIPIIARQSFSDLLLSAWNSSSPLNIHLFHADFTPGDDDVLADYSAIEADFGGYAALAIEDWTDDGLDTDDRRVIKATSVLWTQTSGGDQVYGYYVTDAGDAFLWFAEKFTDGPIVVDSSTPNLYLIPRFAFTSEF